MASNSLAIDLATRFLNLLERGYLRGLTALELDSFCDVVFHKSGRLTNCFAFIDGTTFEISRPNESKQRAFYSGHKRHHVVKIQGVMGVNGMFLHSSTVFEGCRNDRGMFLASDLQTTLSMLQPPPQQPPRSYVLYGDGGYTMGPYLVTPFLLPNHAQLQFNTDMAKSRIAVEMGFKRVKSLWPFLKMPDRLHLENTPIGALILCGVLLTNVRTCVEGRNQISDYFGIAPPTLEQYISFA